MTRLTTCVLFDISVASCDSVQQACARELCGILESIDRTRGGCDEGIDNCNGQYCQKCQAFLLDTGAPCKQFARSILRIVSAGLSAPCEGMPLILSIKECHFVDGHLAVGSFFLGQKIIRVQLILNLDT